MVYLGLANSSMTSRAVLLRVAATRMFFSGGYQLLKQYMILFDMPEPNGSLFEINFSFENTLGSKHALEKWLAFYSFELHNHRCPHHLIEDGTLRRHWHYITLFFAFCLPCGTRMMINVVTVQGATFDIINILLCKIEVAELSTYKGLHKH